MSLLFVVCLFHRAKIYVLEHNLKMCAQRHGYIESWRPCSIISVVVSSGHYQNQCFPRPLWRFMASLGNNDVIAESALSRIYKANEQLHCDCPVIIAINNEDPFKRYIHNTVRCRYNALNFLQNSDKIHPIARPLGRGVGFILWFQTAIYFASFTAVMYAMLYWTTL